MFLVPGSRVPFHIRINGPIDDNHHINQGENSDAIPDKFPPNKSHTFQTQYDSDKHQRNEHELKEKEGVILIVVGPFIHLYLTIRQIYIILDGAGHIC
jgi:hypothetical protein